LKKISFHNLYLLTFFYFNLKKSQKIISKNSLIDELEKKQKQKRPFKSTASNNTNANVIPPPPPPPPPSNTNNTQNSTNNIPITNTLLTSVSSTSSTPIQLKIDHNNQVFSCLTWGHNDQRLFVACSNTLHVLRVQKEMPTFSLLAQLAIKQRLHDTTQLHLLEPFLSERLREQLKYCMSSSVKTLYPRVALLRQFVCGGGGNLNGSKNERLHCTLKCLSNVKSSHDYYTLYLEYLGGLIPLLSARKSSKLKPDFVIFDPYLMRKRKDTKKAKIIAKNKKKLEADDGEKVKKSVKNVKTRATKKKQKESSQISHHLLENEEEEEEEVDVENGKRTYIY
jgi:hypothetical protein